MADTVTLITATYLVFTLLPLYPLYKIARLIWWPPFILSALMCSLSFIGAGISSFFLPAPYITFLLMLGFLFYALTFFLLLRVLRKGLRG